MTCELCTGTQLVPFVKGGRVIKDVMLDCECKVVEPEHFHDTSPEDIDFPCSDTFRGYFTEQYGNSHDRMIERDINQARREPEPITIQQSQPWDKRQQYQLDQTRNELISIRHKLLEMTGKKLEPGKAHPVKKSGYKGLVVNDG